jgi:hypothetical protein
VYQRIGSLKKGFNINFMTPDAFGWLASFSKAFIARNP